MYLTTGSLWGAGQDSVVWASTLASSATMRAYLLASYSDNIYPALDADFWAGFTVQSLSPNLISTIIVTISPHQPHRLL